MSIPQNPTLSSGPQLTENLTETRHPETLLAALKERASRATSDTEKAKYADLVAKLEHTLSEKRTGLVQEGKDVLADFKAGLSPEQKHTLDQVSTSVHSGTEAARVAVGGSVESAQALAKKAEQAARSGDYTEIKKIAEGARESVNEAGQKVLEYSGAAALGKLLEPIHKEGIAGVMTVLGNLVKFMTNGFKISEVVGPVGEKAQEAKEAVQAEVKKRTPELTPEQKQEMKEASIAQSKKWIEDRYFNGVELSPERAKALVGILEKHKFPEEVIRDKGEKWQKEWKLAVGDGLELLEKYAFGNASIIFELLIAGVIPASKFAVSMVQESLNAPKQHFALTLDGVGISPAMFWFDEINSLVASVGDDPQKKASLLYLLYKPASLFASISGTMVAATASLGVSLLTNTTVDGIKMGKDVMRAHALGNYEPILQNFAELEKKLGVAASSGSHIDELRRLQGLTQDVQKNYRLIQALEVEAKAPGTLKQFAELDDIVGKAAANQIRSTNNLDEIRRLVTKNLKGSDAVDWLKQLSQDVQKFGGNGSARVLEHAEVLNGILDTQKQLAARSVVGVKYLGALEDISKIATISRVQDTTLLMIQKTEDMQQLRVAFMKLGTQGIKHLFNGIPLIGLSAGTYELLSQEKKAEASGWLKMIGSALSMPVAGLVLLSEVEINKNEGLTLENTGKWALGMALLGGSVIHMAKNPRGAVAFITGYSTLKTAGETIGAAFRWARIVGAVAPKLWAQLVAVTSKAAVEVPGRAKIGAVTLAAAAGLALYLGKTMGNDPHEALVKEGYVDSQSGKLTPEFGKKFAELKPEAKKEILDAIVTAKLPKDVIDTAKSIYEPGSYRLEVPGADVAKMAQRKLNEVQDELARWAAGLSEVVITQSAHTPSQA